MASVHDLRVALNALIYRVEQRFSRKWDGSMDVDLDLHQAQRARNNLIAQVEEARQRGRNVTTVKPRRPK